MTCNLYYQQECGVSTIIILYSCYRLQWSITPQIDQSQNKLVAYTFVYVNVSVHVCAIIILYSSSKLVPWEHCDCNKHVLLMVIVASKIINP